jgi:hypothetical protein
MLCNGYDDVVEPKSGELAELRDVRGATLRVTRHAVGDADRRPCSR